MVKANILERSKVLLRGLPSRAVASVCDLTCFPTSLVFILLSASPTLSSSFACTPRLVWNSNAVLKLALEPHHKIRLFMNAKIMLDSSGEVQDEAQPCV